MAEVKRRGQQPDSDQSQCDHHPGEAEGEARCLAMADADEAEQVVDEAELVAEEVAVTASSDSAPASAWPATPGMPATSMNCSPDRKSVV